MLFALAVKTSELSLTSQYLVPLILTPSSVAYPYFQTQWGTNLVISSRSMLLRCLGTPIIRAVSLGERKSSRRSSCSRGVAANELGKCFKAVTSSAVVWAFCLGGEPTVTIRKPNTQKWKGRGEKRSLQLTDNYSIPKRLNPIKLLQDSCEWV